MPGIPGHGLVPLALCGRDGPTHVNPAAVATVTEYRGRGKAPSGAVLRFVDGSSVRTDTPLAAVLELMSRAP
jgi:hypothetical protein